MVKNLLEVCINFLAVLLCWIQLVSPSALWITWFLNSQFTVPVQDLFFFSILRFSSTQIDYSSTEGPKTNFEVMELEIFFYKSPLTLYRSYNIIYIHLLKLNSLQHMFAEHLLCARHFARHQQYLAKIDKHILFQAWW